MPVRAHVDHVSDCDLWIKKSQPPYVPSVAIFGTFRRQISHIRRLAQAEEWLAAGAGLRLAAIAAAECPPWRGRIRRLLSPLRKWSSRRSQCGSRDAAGNRPIFFGPTGFGRERWLNAQHRPAEPQPQTQLGARAFTTFSDPAARRPPSARRLRSRQPLQRKRVAAAPHPTRSAARSAGSAAA